MAHNTKRNRLLLLFGVLVSLVLLATSLSNLQFHSGGPFPGDSNTTLDSQPVTSPTPVRIYGSTILNGIVTLILVILVLTVVVRLIALVNTRRTFQLLLVIVILLGTASLIRHVPESRGVVAPPGESNATVLPSFDYPVSALGEPPQALIWFVFVGFLVGVSLLVIKVLKQWQSITRVEDQLLQEAELAVNAIMVGENLHNAIIRCYLQMTRALQEEQKIERSDSMTVQEFEDWLERKGFPGVAVHNLSRLYEGVRYGQQKLTRADEQTAVESLNEIIRFCRSTKG